MSPTIRILLIAGARPNFIRIAPSIITLHAAQPKGATLKYLLTYMELYYYRNMSGLFF